MGPHQPNDWGYCDICGEDLLFAPNNTNKSPFENSDIIIQRGFTIFNRKEYAILEEDDSDDQE